MSHDEPYPHSGTLNKASSPAKQDSSFKKARFAWQIKGHLTKGSSKDSSVAHTNKIVDHENSGASRSLDDCKFEHELDDNTAGETVCSVTVSDDMLDCQSDREKKNSNNDKFQMKMDACTDANSSNIKQGTQNSDVGNTNDCTYSNKRKYTEIETENNSKRACVSKSVKIFGDNPRNNDFRSLSSVLTSYPGLDVPSFIWQKQEMGCAIVDNVFNRTLEEMGLSPDPKVNLIATTRLTLENQGIETAIRNRGLHASGSQSEQRGHAMRNMEQYINTATMEDFQNTTDQLRMHLCRNVTADTSINNSLETDLSESASSIANCSIKENMSVSNSSISDGAGANNMDTETNPHVKETEFDESFEDATLENHINSAAEFSKPVHQNFIAMEASESFPYDSEHTDACNVLDLAVSTAIQSQGLTAKQSKCVP